MNLQDRASAGYESVANVGLYVIEMIINGGEEARALDI
jgi:hypothetical protein